MPNVIAVDPGGTTGVAVRIGETITTCTCKTPEELYDLITSSGWEAIAIEPFTPFNAASRISKYGLYTVRLVGGVQALAYHLKIPIVEQPPAKRIPFVRQANELLVKMRRDFVVHEVDALSHLLCWERYNGRKASSTSVRRNG
jgi:hypothetical protein